MFNLFEKNKVSEKENITSKGLHIISICNMESERAQRLQYSIENLRLRREFLIKSNLGTPERLHKLWMEYHHYLDQLHKRFLKRQFAVENITTTVGRSVFCQRLVGTTTYTGTVTYCALGTSSTAPAVGNTTLVAETYRKALSPSTYSNNIAYLEQFLSSTDTNGTFEEFGFFIDGTGAANSGVLFNRFTQSVTKSNVESLNIQSTVTVADA